MFLSLFAFTSNVQSIKAVDWTSGVFDDDFEAYGLGNLDGQGGWSGSSIFQVVNTLAHSGTKSAYSEAYDTFYSISKNGSKKQTGIQSIYVYFSDVRKGATNEILLHLRGNSELGGSLLDTYGFRYNSSTSKWEFVYQNGSAPYDLIVMRDDISEQTWHSIQAEFDEPNWEYRLKLDDGDWSNWLDFFDYLDSESIDGVEGLRILTYGTETWLDTIDGVLEPGTTYIRANGSIDPPTAPIQRSGDVYTFTSSIYGSLVVERDSIAIDGNGYMLQGAGVDGSKGIDLSGRAFVTVQNTLVMGFYYGIYLYSSSDNVIKDNIMINNRGDGIKLSYSTRNSVTENNMTNNLDGIGIVCSTDNNILGNNASDNTSSGIYLWQSNDNSVVKNEVKINNLGIWLGESSNNIIYHNNFINNNEQFSIDSVGYANSWDDGYPSGGNYWNDYATRYPAAAEIDDSGVWDMPYVIDAYNQDRYPLVNNAPLIYIPSRIKVLTNPSEPPVEMDIEEYLRGVVHLEMNPQVFEPLLGLNEEQMLIALKAQAIASRTYAVARVLGMMWNPHHGSGADVCTQECCQMWSSVTDTLSDLAVGYTRNMVITYAGHIIQAAFFGHCDGHTRTTLTAYPKPWSKDLPYCRSVACACGQTSMLGHGVGMCQYGAMEMAKQGYDYEDILKHYYSGVEIDLTYPIGTFNVAKLGCPGELRVFDSENRITGVMNGEIMSEIPNSSYDDANKAVIVVFPNDSYRYVVEGTNEGLYNLTIANVTQSQAITFVASDVPTLDNTTDRYTIDWATLSAGGEGVDVQVDSDNDGIFEYSFTSDSDLTRLEYVAATTQHDIEIVSIARSKSVVGQGYSMLVDTAIMNYGVYAETFNVTCYVNTTLIGLQTVIIANGTLTKLTFTWNTTGFVKGNYTISAYAEPVIGENYTTDNRKEDGLVIVTIPGDFNGDSTVDGNDFFILLQAWGTTPPSDPRADANNDGLVDGGDFFILLQNWGKT